MSYERLTRTLALIFACLWSLLAIAPRNRMDWALENVLVLLAVPLFISAYKRRLFSRLSLVCLFVFLCLHEIGAHFSYSHVPYDEWWRMLTGGSLNELLGWQRNHFDRAIHFLYGLLMAYPMREIFLRVANARGFWGYFLPLDLTMSSSLLYELIEWLAVALLGEGAGQAWLGAQGDPWDAHKDMALAALGAILTMLLTALVNWRCQRDFAREWSESWRVKSRAE
jgi:putative membrane protein